MDGPRRLWLEQWLAAGRLFASGRLRLAKLAVGLPVVQCTEPHDAIWVVVVDVMALGGLGAADFAGLTFEIASSYLVGAVASCVAFRVLLACVWARNEV
jgi:hypothetical protein